MTTHENPALAGGVSELDRAARLIASEISRTAANAQAGPPPLEGNGFYVFKDIKRKRRTKAAIDSVRDQIEDILEHNHPQTVRQVFYALTVRGAVAKQEIEARDKPAHIYHFGDLDPSGVDAARDIEAKLRRYAPAAEIHFERPAVTRAQAEEWNLQTRPTKQTDTRAKGFGSSTVVELDAIPADKLRELVRACIERHVNQDQLQILRAAEESERELLKKWATTYGGGQA